MPRNRTVWKNLLHDEEFEDINTVKLRRLIGMGMAEMAGTAAIVALGCGSVVGHIVGSDTAHLNITLSFAFAISTCIGVFGHISGGIFNPALNLAAVILGKMSLYKCLYYTLCQLLGGGLAILFVNLVTPSLPQHFCVTFVNHDIDVMQGLLVEILITALLTVLFCSVVDERNAGHSGFIPLKFAIGVTAIALPSAKYTGCSMNPARSFGPALISNHWEHHWVYWLGPLLGAAFSATLYVILFDPSIYRQERRLPTKESELQPMNSER